MNYVSLYDKYAFRPVSHVNMICIVFCYINLYKTITPYGVAICDPRDFI